MVARSVGVGLGFAVLVVVAPLAGCGYALAGKGNALPATIRIIGVPDFQNRSPIPDLDRLMTSAVREEFQGRGRYTIKPDAVGVDGVFTGIILSVTFRPSTFTADNQVARENILVTASVEFKEVATGKNIWTNPSFQFRDEFQKTTGATATDATANLTQDREAQERIAKAVARSVVTSVFEAF
jgi:hypothetical protein